MTLQSWLIYLTLVLVATSTPGPAVLYIVTSSTQHGWKKAVFAALGNIAGLFCLGFLAVTGLGAIIRASELAFDIIKFIGAAYLVYLGIRLIIQRIPTDSTSERCAVYNGFSAGRTFFQAFGVAMSNPKAIVFLTALFPQFIALEQPLVPQFAVLILTLMLLSFFFLMFYAFLSHNATSWMKNPARLRVFNRVSGSAFICFGVLLAVSSQK